MQTLLPLSFSLQNIRVWDLQDYVCLQSFCGKLFPLGNCPITSAYFHRDRTLICSTYNVSAAVGMGTADGLSCTGLALESVRLWLLSFRESRFWTLVHPFLHPLLPLLHPYSCTPWALLSSLHAPFPHQL